MQVEKIEEAGYRSAMIGLGLNKKKGEEHAAKIIAPKLCDKDGGHNKFLEHMEVWIKVRAPRYWWQEADTYRLSSKQSESTMHTLIDELQAVEVTNEEAVLEYFKENFESAVDDPEYHVQKLYKYSSEKDLVRLKANLPEGFLQTRVWKMSYKTLRNMFQQRKTHRLPHWPDFISQVISQLDHQELIEEALS